MSEAPGFRALPADQALDFSIEARETLAGGFHAFDRLTIRHASMTGNEPLRVTRDVLRTRPAVVIIPYDPVSDTIVTVRQFRVGAALVTPHAAALELPAGLLDEGEAPRDTAIRELKEETGLPALAIQEVFSFLPSPGTTDERIVVFLALVDAARLSGSAGLAEEHEEIVPVRLSVEDLLEAVDAGRIANGFLFASLNWFARRGRAMAQILADSIEDPAT